MIRETPQPKFESEFMRGQRIFEVYHRRFIDLQNSRETDKDEEKRKLGELAKQALEKMDPKIQIFRNRIEAVGEELTRADALIQKLQAKGIKVPDTLLKSRTDLLKRRQELAEWEEFHHNMMSIRDLLGKSDVSEGAEEEEVAA
ncbi:MAG: hypothetical protein AAB420_01590 [Patescibacteria group bacterium]